ncbi:hypothetical protein BV25DRAFT_1838601 [Artomyces pyxidatus]|uniref:Uncharacterized protein n=1 Tax=Artomyces pyxidatus TaxID=48021 RepID=A0ACB8T092_9AGAM|nr:hypothetical protein BV25DRAFT_1838601 [Artomyces pyxidatus]
MTTELRTTEYADLERAVVREGLHHTVLRLSEWDDKITGILSITQLARALHLPGFNVDRKIPQTRESTTSCPMVVEWRCDKWFPGGDVVEFLFESGGRGPIRVWMVGILDDHEFDYFARRSAYVFTAMCPLYKESMYAANAVLSNWTSKEDAEYFNWFGPSNPIQASTDRTDPLSYLMFAHDRPSIMRWVETNADRLFDACDAPDPMDSRTPLSPEDFHNGDLVLQECIMRRNRSNSFIGIFSQGDIPSVYAIALMLALSYTVSDTVTKALRHTKNSPSFASKDHPCSPRRDLKIAIILVLVRSAPYSARRQQSIIEAPLERRNVQITRVFRRRMDSRDPHETYNARTPDDIPGYIHSYRAATPHPLRIKGSLPVQLHPPAPPTMPSANLPIAVLGGLNDLLSDLHIGTNHVPFVREIHYHRTPGYFTRNEMSVLTRSIRCASCQYNIELGLFGPSHQPAITHWGTREIRHPARNPLPFPLSFRPTNRPFALSIVARLVEASFTGSNGLPVPHVFVLFVPFYYSDALAIHQLLFDRSCMPDLLRPSPDMRAALRADRHLPDDSDELSVSFRPFDSVYDGRLGYHATEAEGMNPRLPMGNLLPDDLVVCITSIYRFATPLRDGTCGWTASLRLESVTLLQHSSVTTSLELSDSL